MTDTTPEAVEQLAAWLDRYTGDEATMFRGSTLTNKAATLRALARELAEVKAERDLLKNWQDHNATEVPRLQMQLDTARAQTLTADKLANAFDVVWNAAIGESHRQQDGIVFAAILAESFRAMSAALKGDLSGR